MSDEPITTDQLRPRDPDHTYDHDPLCDDNGWDHRGPCVNEEAAKQPALTIVPVDWRTARAFVTDWHRHLPPPRGYRFAVGVADAGRLVGVVIVGRPIGRHTDDGVTLEVTRVATDGTPNACSALYAASWRAARALGYCRLVTLTRADESGASLRGAGWRVIAERPVHAGWDRPSRRRGSPVDAIPRTLWEAP